MTCLLSSASWNCHFVFFLPHLLARLCLHLCYWAKFVNPVNFHFLFAFNSFIVSDHLIVLDYLTCFCASPAHSQGTLGIPGRSVAPHRCFLVPNRLVLVQSFGFWEGGSWAEMMMKPDSFPLLTLSCRKIWVVSCDSTVWDWRRQVVGSQTQLISHYSLCPGQLSSPTHHCNGERFPFLYSWSEPMLVIRRKKIFWPVNMLSRWQVFVKN